MFLELQVKWTNSEIIAGQKPVGFQVARRRGGCHFSGKRRSRWPLVPIKRLQIVADKLFIKRRLRFSRAVAFCRPEPRRIRSQGFVNKDYFTVLITSKFKLGVGDYYPRLRA